MIITLNWALHDIEYWVVKTIMGTLHSVQHEWPRLRLSWEKILWEQICDQSHYHPLVISFTTSGNLNILNSFLVTSEFMHPAQIKPHSNNTTLVQGKHHCQPCSCTHWNHCPLEPCYQLFPIDPICMTSQQRISHSHLYTLQLLVSRWKQSCLLIISLVFSIQTPNACQTSHFHHLGVGFKLQGKKPHKQMGEVSLELCILYTLPRLNRTACLKHLTQHGKEN